MIRDIFADQVTPGSKLKLKDLQSNFKVAKRVQDNAEKLKTLVRGKYGLRAKNPSLSRWHKKFAIASLVFGIILLSPPLLVMALVTFVLSITLHPLTDKGLTLVRYLKGLEMYIKLAEADRIKTLQSPKGAERVGDMADEAKLIKFYERLLPYAVLFGVEKQWNKELGRHYENMKQQPDWYIGSSSIYSAAAFSTAISSFKTSASYTSSSGSSSGGSGGGGFSGGGGGGGGGGGW